MQSDTWLHTIRLNVTTQRENGTLQTLPARGFANVKASEGSLQENTTGRWSMSPIAGLVFFLPFSLLVYL